MPKNRPSTSTNLLGFFLYCTNIVAACLWASTWLANIVVAFGRAALRLRHIHHISVAEEIPLLSHCFNRRTHFEDKQLFHRKFKIRQNRRHVWKYMKSKTAPFMTQFFDKESPPPFQIEKLVKPTHNLKSRCNHDFNFYHNFSKSIHTSTGTLVMLEYHNCLAYHTHYCIGCC